MTTTIYELRKKLKLAFKLNESNFHLIADENLSSNRLFKYSSNVSAKNLKGNMNWFISISIFEY
jgi:hypothetical protein